MPGLFYRKKNKMYTPYDPADIILDQIDINKVLGILSEQDCAIFLWWITDGYILPDIAKKLKKQYGAPKKLTEKDIGVRIKLITNQIRKYLGKKDLYYVTIESKTIKRRSINELKNTKKRKN